MVKAAISIPDNGPATGARKRKAAGSDTQYHHISDNSQTSSGRNRKRTRATYTQEQKDLEKERKVMARKAMAREEKAREEKARDERLKEAYKKASEDWRKHLKWHCVAFSTMRIQYRLALPL